MKLEDYSDLQGRDSLRTTKKIQTCKEEPRSETRRRLRPTRDRLAVKNKENHSRRRKDSP